MILAGATALIAAHVLLVQPAVLSYGWLRSAQSGDCMRWPVDPASKALPLGFPERVHCDTGAPNAMIVEVKRGGAWNSCPPQAYTLQWLGTDICALRRTG